MTTWCRVAVVAVVLASGVAPLVRPADADLVCRKKKGQLLARPACKAKESPLDLAAILTPGDGLALDGNTLRLTGHARVLYFPSTALSYSDTASDPFTRTDLGLQVAPHSAGSNGNPPPAVLTVPRPPDWDGTSPVVAHLYLIFNYGPDATNNIVKFRIKQYAVDLGEGLANAAWGDADAPITVTDGYQVLREDFTVDPTYAARQFWYLQFGRGDALNGQTYPYPIVITGLELEYTAVR